VLFYGLTGSGLPFSRMLFGVDLSVPLAALVVLYFVAVVALEIRDQLGNLCTGRATRV
jgi:hypothetical protein